jgi:hypothetical protein
MTSVHDRSVRLREVVVPGWLAEALPDWLTEAVRPKPAPVPWGAMVRAPLAICVPLLVGFVVGRRDIGLVSAVGGLIGTVVDAAGPYVVRVKRMVTAAVFGGVAGLVIGMLIHHRGWVAVACLVVVAGVSAVISRLGSTGSVTGLLLLIFAALGLGAFGALRPWWHIALGFLAGVAWELLLLVPGWRAPPGPPNRAPSPTSITRWPTTCARSVPTAPPGPGARSRPRSTPRTTPCFPRGRQPPAEAGA